MSTTELTAALDDIKNHLDGRVDALEADFKARAVGRTDSPAKTAYSADGLLTKDQSLAGTLESKDGNDGVRGPERLGALIQAMVTHKTADLTDAEAKAVSGTASPDGGILVPEIVSGDVIDLARNATRVFEAGALTLPMTSRYVVIPKMTEGVTAGWRAENDAIAEGDPQLGYVRLNAESLAVLVKFSREILEDSTPDVWQLIANDVTAELGKRIDYAALLGSGTGSEPLGLANAPGVGEVASVGTPADYDDVLDAMADVEASNFTPRTWILNSRDSRKFRGLTTGISGDKTKLTPPADVAALQRLVTNQIPNTLGGGNESVQFVGDFANLVVGFRPEVGIRIQRLDEAFADHGQIGLIAHIRADVAVRNGGAFSVLRGVTP